MPRPYDSDTAKAPDKACRRSQEALGEWPYLPLSLAILWLWSGLQPVLAAPQESLQLLARIGVPSALQWPLLCAASAWDVLLGILILTPLRRLPALWLLQSASIAAYTLIIACCLPAYWLHPFAPLVKNLPLLALTVYFYQQTRSS